MELPTEKIKATRLDPKRLLLFGLPKVGKTTIMSQLDDCLIIDCEEGSDYVDALKIDVSTFKDVETSLKLLSENKGTHKKNPYKYIAIDTVTVLEEIVLPFAGQLYKQEPMGKNWKGDNVTKLPNGAGYQYLRDAFFRIIDAYAKYCDTIILIGHVKDKLLSKEGEEYTEKSVDLTGKIASMAAAKVDAIGYMYAKDNDRYIDFSPSENTVAGNRAKHLSGKKIKISERLENGEVKVNWNEIFIEK